jgi:hypothetical protein
MVNLVFNDLTSKPKLPIFWLTIAIAWNISTVLLLPNTSFAIFYTYLGVKLCGVSSLEASFDDIPLSLIYKLKSISNPCPSTNHNLFCGSTMASGLKSLNVGPNTTICGSLDGCDYCFSICGYGNYTSSRASPCGLPSEHENYINHPLHHIAYVCVTLVMLLLLPPFLLMFWTMIPLWFGWIMSGNHS